MTFLLKGKSSTIKRNGTWHDPITRCEILSRGKTIKPSTISPLIYEYIWAIACSIFTCGIDGWTDLPSHIDCLLISQRTFNNTSVFNSLENSWKSRCYFHEIHKKSPCQHDFYSIKNSSKRVEHVSLQGASGYTFLTRHINAIITKASVIFPCCWWYF